ncbi:hypothetical protein [Arsenophonus sp. PmNCSU2021_1]|uniref:hypothetical protein n=1 Tax=Arsenophonus sp. PmNCSU2021_1 TaxID=3118989 RepID=UPI002FEEC7BE
MVFYDVAKALYSSNTHQKALQQLITNQKQINHYSELASLPKVSLVAFHENNYTVKKLMVSLGDGKFAIRHADHLELAFGGNFTQLADGKFGPYQVTAGKVNLSAMRQASLSRVTQSPKKKYKFKNKKKSGCSYFVGLSMY